jgi:hypothetical protein
MLLQQTGTCGRSVECRLRRCDSPLVDFARRRRNHGFSSSIASGEAKKNGAITNQSAAVSGTASKKGAMNGT